jgi:hypothetical protein
MSSVTIASTRPTVAALVVDDDVELPGEHAVEAARAPAANGVADDRLDVRSGVLVGNLPGCAPPPDPVRWYTLPRHPHR